MLHELAAAEAAKLSDDPKEAERAKRTLHERRMMRAADMTLMSGFVLGAAANDYASMAHGGGVWGSYDGIGSDGAGGFGGGEG